MSTGNEELGKARAQIDAIDTELQTLISQRARVAEQVREIKERNGGAVGDHYRPAREAEVLKRAMARNQGPLPDEMMAHLMREIMSACLALESPLSVSYLGPEGTYTQAAVYKHFGHQVAARAVSAIDEIFRDVESGIAAYGVVPIENSTEGVVSSTLDLLANTPLSICGEVWLPVHHQLLTRHERFEDVQVIYAHPQSFAQCRAGSTRACLARRARPWPATAPPPSGWRRAGRARPSPAPPPASCTGCACLPPMSRTTPTTPRASW